MLNSTSIKELLFYIYDDSGIYSSSYGTLLKTLFVICMKIPPNVSIMAGLSSSNMSLQLSFRNVFICLLRRLSPLNKFSKRVFNLKEKRYVYILALRGKQ